MKKDWSSNKSATFVTLAATNHGSGEREQNDYYATDPRAVEMLLEFENFNDDILECACGEGHISKVLIDDGFNVRSIDLVDRGYGEVKDFFEIKTWDGDIITNPPYKKALEFVKHAIDIIPYGNKVAMFLKIQFLESQSRRVFFEEHPPKYIYVFSKRINCAKNGDFDKYNSLAVCYAWYIWEKGFNGESVIRWI